MAACRHVAKLNRVGCRAALWWTGCRRRRRAVAYGPVDRDEMTMRALLIGRLPPAGGNMPRELPGGPLADRVPKA